MQSSVPNNFSWHSGFFHHYHHRFSMIRASIPVCILNEARSQVEIAMSAVFIYQSRILIIVCKHPIYVNSIDGIQVYSHYYTVVDEA